MPQVKPAPAPEPLLLGLDGDDETLSERGSVGSGSAPSTPDARGGNEASSSTPSPAGSKKKRESLSCDRVEADGPEPTRSSSSDTTWSMDSLRDGCPRSLSRKKNGRSEHSVTSAALISRPRGVLKLRKLPQNASAETGAGGCNVLQPNGISKPAHFMRRKRIRKPRGLKENRVGGDDPVSCSKTENGTHDQDITTKSCSGNDLLVPKLSGEPSKPLDVGKDSAGHAQGHIDVSLEENAAMMLCSLSDNRHDDPLRNRMASPDRSSNESNLHHSNHLKNQYKNENDVAGPSRLLRKRDGKGPFRKRRPRRHFYEVSPHDLDPFSIVKERIRVFWPLDETWYFGLVKKYDPVTKRHHVKYDDKDEEWINLQNERIKLLLLPGEGRRRCINNTSRKARKVNYEGEKREDMDGNGSGSESEPIISWLARSNQVRSGTSSSISKTVIGHPNIVPVLSNSFDANPGFFASNGAIPGGLPANGGPEVHNDGTTAGERRFRFFYSRRRFCRRMNGFVNISEHDSHLKIRASSAAVLASTTGREADTETGAPVKYVILVVSLPLKSVYKLISEACSAWLPSTFVHPQHGSLITLWPAVCLDILLVDDTLSLKHLLLETCLRSAVSLFCSLVGSFNKDSGLNAFKESEAPCTSVRFQISGLHGRSQVAFVLFNLFGIGKTQWKNLQAKVRYHSLKRELSKVGCTYADIKQLISGNDQNVRTSVNLFSKSLSFDVQEPQFCSVSNHPDADPVIFCLDNQSGCTQNHVDVAAARHHLKLLTETNLTSNAVVHQPAPSEIFVEKNQQSISQHRSVLVDQACSLEAGTVSLDCDDNSDGDINVISRRLPDQNGTCIAGDKLCSSNHNVTNSPEKSKQNYPSIDIPQDKISDALDDELLSKDDKATEPVSNLVQELNEHPIGRVTPTAPRTSYHRNRFTSISRTFGDGSKLWPEDTMSTGIAGGSKKTRTHVSYSVSPRSDELGSKHKGHFRKIQPHNIAKTNGSKRLPDNTRSGESSPESLACVANVLVTVGDRGWREYDTQITIDTDGQSDRRICVRLAEGKKYIHKVSQVLQPGATNRYTHAMLWKGGPEWNLEFPDRSQWSIFKQMHDECYSHNIRAASVKNIPIPGVRLVEDHDDNEVVLFVRPQDYICHIGPDVEMALDESRVIYDMDSDDEEWISGWRKSQRDKNNTMSELTEDLFEKIMDKFEKFAHTHNCSALTIDQLKELDVDSVPLDITEVVHDHWHDKRQKKGMPLVRHFQPVMWKIYAQQLQEWESAVNRMQGSSNGYQGKRPPPKPALFAFCLKPRGLRLQVSKGPKQRSHKKLMYSGCHSFSREQDGFYRQGRRSGEYVGDGRTYESYDGGSLNSPTGYSPRFSMRTDSPRASDASDRGSTPRFRTNSVKRNASFAFSEDHQPSPSFRSQKIRRGGVPDHWNTAIHEYQNSKQALQGGPPQSQRVDVEELKLRDATSAAQHAVTMARLKREKAHCLMHKADLALHKASVAVMIADAIKASSRDSSRASAVDSRRDDGR
ncbi:uncharacterized protein LOC123442978 isoform X2 [Hordeum vulgare subsp. vulgare]|uniref:uncharacterized protein LOC123442978 isoform X2 n=1 Tax=Hordeum vulgare subsp. vulgare TaxID=112509 RepID=UPI001D1A51BC|nr:uncharacterized protein LOC123442978 isoform X2 [Hordeum vulgare subsp. vulgare]